MLTALQRCAALAAAMTLLTCATCVGQSDKKPHAVFVIGTTHYNPGGTMPKLAAQLQNCGFRTTVIRPRGNPEKKPNGIPGLDALKKADIAVFYLRFLTLPDSQLKIISDYLESGKPVVGFRTSSHAFAYPKDDPRSKWNDGFGRDAIGTKYFIHLRGKTQVSVNADAKSHPILEGIALTEPETAAGTLYLSKLPKDAKVLLRGTGKSKRTGTVTNQFGTHELKATMTQPVAWTWKNKWGGRVFGTSLGKEGTFENPKFVRFFLNGICWAANVKVPSDSKATAIKVNARLNAANPRVPNMKDARNTQTTDTAPPEDPEYLKYGIYAKTAPRAKSTTPADTSLPLTLNKNARIALVGNTLFDRAQLFGYFETLLHQRYPKHNLIVRNLAWSADTPDLQPRPDNFADQDQHLTHEKIDVIFAAYGFNESFAGESGLPAFKQSLTKYVQTLKAKAFNGKSAPQIVLVSPIANENIKGVAAGSRNNPNIKLYVDALRDVATEQNVWFADVFEDTLKAMEPDDSDMTLNGSHLLERGYDLFARSLFEKTFGESASDINEQLRTNVVDKNRQFMRRYRPLNTFYYTGGRNKAYGYLDFLPAMKNFDIMVANRDARSWKIAAGEPVPAKVDDSNLPPLPDTKKSRGANTWKSAADELKDFEVDPRFDVNLFAGEEEFPEIAAPIQMRWDSKGRLWVSCSTTYPHVYPGKEPNDRLVILEDTDGDGKADKSTTFADDLHIPLSFEFGNGGVYVSESPHLTFIKDTDGDGKADFRQELLTGFGTEDSHHALHDFTWTPDGDLLFREAIFHHSQVETPYGPVRQQNSGWFRFDPETHRLTSFGTYHSTNPWGVTFDDWGQHMASHPIYAAAFHSLDPPFPNQHPRPAGLQAYSGTCGQEFVDFATFPKELKGHFIKARYKPTNRIEIHEWNETPFGFEEKYVSDLIFSKNLSFIPVDLRYGPRGAMYVCDWYNPVKGHAQYSLRDERRDRHSGRIWRITAKGKKLQPMPKIAGATIPELLELLKRPEYRIRFLAKRELRERSPRNVATALDAFLSGLDRTSSRFRHHQLEALWLYRSCHIAGRGNDVACIDETVRIENLCDHPAAKQRRVATVACGASHTFAVEQSRPQLRSSDRRKSLADQTRPLLRPLLRSSPSCPQPDSCGLRHTLLSLRVVPSGLFDWRLSLVGVLHEPLNHQQSGDSAGPSRKSAHKLLYELLNCENHLARAAAVEQLRYWQPELHRLDADRVQKQLTKAANDENGIVRMQAAIACSYIGTPQALDIALQTLNHPAEKHVAYAIQCALGSHTLRRHWENNPKYKIAQILAKLKRSSDLKEPSPSASQQQFDLQKNLKTVRISCMPERMLFTVNQFAVTTGQPIKLVFTNPDATDHNLVIVKPGALAEVGMAANAMARDPKNANSNFIPSDKKKLILKSAPMIGPTRKSQVHVMRFKAPKEPGIYPFVCTFPGHWIIMKGDMVVANDLSEVDQMLAARKPTMVQEWKMSDFDSIEIKDDEATAMRGMQAFVKAQCNQCHMVAGHGINLGPDLTDIHKRFTGMKLLKQILEPSSEINKKYQNHQFLMESGKLISGVIVDESPAEYKVVSNLLNPNAFVRVNRKQIDEQTVSSVSAMPAGLANVLSKEELTDLVSFLQTGGYKLPKHLKHGHMQHGKN